MAVEERPVDPGREGARGIGGANWQSQLVPASMTSVPIAATALDGIVAMAVDAVGNVSAGTVWRP